MNHYAYCRLRSAFKENSGEEKIEVDGNRRRIDHDQCLERIK